MSPRSISVPPAQFFSLISLKRLKPSVHRKQGEWDHGIILVSRGHKSLTITQLQGNTPYTHKSISYSVYLNTSGSQKSNQDCESNPCCTEGCTQDMRRQGRQWGSGAQSSGNGLCSMLNHQPGGRPDALLLLYPLLRAQPRHAALRCD